MKKSNLYRLHPKDKFLQAVKEIDFSDFNFKERSDIQEWVEATPQVLGEDLLIISKELTHFSGTRERPDLIAIDKEANIVIIELKRDDSGSALEWQAIKYASYLSKFKKQNIVNIYQQYLTKIESDIDFTDDLVEQRILDFIDTDDLDNLNKFQRIILVSHRYAKEVTSAVNWLINNYDMEIKCVQLIPFFDKDKNTYYLQSNVLLPLIGEEDLVITAASKGQPSRKAVSETIKRNKNDEVSEFFFNVRDAINEKIDRSIIPTKVSRWAGNINTYRYFHFWYKDSLWANWDLSYRVWLYTDIENDENKKDSFYVYLEFCKKYLLQNGITEETLNELISYLKNLNLDEFKFKDEGGLFWIESKIFANELNEKNVALLSDKIVFLISKTKKNIDKIIKKDYE